MTLSSIISDYTYILYACIREFLFLLVSVVLFFHFVGEDLIKVVGLVVSIFIIVLTICINCDDWF